MADTRRMAQAWGDQVIAAGTDPVNHPAGVSQGTWIGFANTYQDRPTTDQRPAHFDDDGRYKIRTKATVSFVTGTTTGKIIPDSESASYESRTGDTHLPRV